MIAATVMRSDELSPHQPIPERQLIAAVIERALRDAIGLAKPVPIAAGRKRWKMSDDRYRQLLCNQIRAESREWILCESDHEWSLVWCIMMLGWGSGDVARMRAMVLEQVPFDHRVATAQRRYDR